MIHTPKIRKNSYKNSGKNSPRKRRRKTLTAMEHMEKGFKEGFGHTPTTEWITDKPRLHILEFEKIEQLEDAMCCFISRVLRRVGPLGWMFYYDKPTKRTKGRLIASLNGGA